MSKVCTDVLAVILPNTRTAITFHPTAFPLSLTVNLHAHDRTRFDTQPGTMNDYSCVLGGTTYSNCGATCLQPQIVFASLESIFTCFWNSTGCPTDENLLLQANGYAQAAIDTWNGCMQQYCVHPDPNLGVVHSLSWPLMFIVRHRRILQIFAPTSTGPLMQISAELGCSCHIGGVLRFSRSLVHLHVGPSVDPSLSQGLELRPKSST